MFYSLLGQATDSAIASGRFDKEFSRNRRPVNGPALLLLTDGFTASASEILVEALCDNRSGCMYVCMYVCIYV